MNITIVICLYYIVYKYMQYACLHYDKLANVYNFKLYLWQIFNLKLLILRIMFSRNKLEINIAILKQLITLKKNGFIKYDLKIY